MVKLAQQFLVLCPEPASFRQPEMFWPMFPATPGREIRARRRAMTCTRSYSHSLTAHLIPRPNQHQEAPHFTGKKRTDQLSSCIFLYVHIVVSLTMKTTPIQSIHVSEAQKNLHSALWLDVRTPAEYDEAHVEGSVLHPLTGLDVEKVRGLAAAKGACFVVCRSGNRATQAADKLAAAGVDSIHVLDGGIQAWESAGLPLTRGAKTMSLERQVRIAAGALVFTGAALGYFVNPAWIGLSGFVGAGLVFAGITDTCGMGMLIARMPWNNRSRSNTSAGSCCAN